MTHALKTLLLAVTAVLFLSACASSNYDQASDPMQVYEISDPFESTNRAVFEFNHVINQAVIHPAVEGYRFVVPDPAREGVSNFLVHLKSPVRFANQLLQGDLEGAGNEALRTVVNTFVGVGGIFDVAGYEGYEYDFGQTLAVWGVPHGPYLVVPLIGPSSARDYVGYAVDSFADPLRLYLVNTDRAPVFWLRFNPTF